MKRDRRLEISETCSSAGMGPLSFDVDMARRHGWSEREINRVWGKLVRAYRTESWRSTRRHPELYHRCSDGTVIFVGPDENGHTLDRSKLP